MRALWTRLHMHVVTVVLSIVIRLRKLDNAPTDLNTEHIAPF